MPKLRVSVSDRGTPLSEGGASATGHLWYELISDDGSVLSFGFAPIEDGSPYGQGEVKRHDNEHYLETEYSQQIDITDYQYQTLLDYAQNPEAYGFSLWYAGWDNSCIDFVWKALDVAGLNEEGYEGAIWPTHNIDALRAELTMPWIRKLNDKLVGDLKDAFGTAETTTSPIILDLDGDGVETVGLSAGVHFDHDGNGFAEASGWVSSDDGLLVLDRNGNGTIDSGSELFGNNSVTKDGSKAENGFLSLGALDENNDGVLDFRDSAFSELQVWVDSNSDGLTQSDELRSLNSVGIVSINTGYSEPGTVDANGDVPSSVVDNNGNEHRQVGSFIRADGSIGIAEDVWFLADGADTVDLSKVAISDSIKSLPDLEGFGNVHSLHIAMALDSSGELKVLLEQFIATTDRATRQNLIIDIIYHWAGVEDIDPASRAATQIYGNVIGDARKLATLETFLGENYSGIWCWGQRDPNPHGPAAAILLQAFDNLAGVVYGQLMMQTHFYSLWSRADLSISESGVSLNAEKIVEELQASYALDAQSGTALMMEFATALRDSGEFGVELLSSLRAAGDVNGDGFYLLLSKLGLANSIGTVGSDVLTGAITDDFLYGVGGDDRLYGGGGNDELVGGQGNDYLVGGNGADTYRYDRGEGFDVILNADLDAANTSLDTLRFGEHVSVSDVYLVRSNYDLVIRVAGVVGSVTIQSYFDEYTLANHGYSIDRIVFADGTEWKWPDVLRIISTPTTGNDKLWGSSVNDVISGGLGDDYLWGQTGDDTLEGAGGNDTLFGEEGSDTIFGGDGNDSLFGEDGNDTLVGGSGNDYLSGRDGNDIYSFGRGWGQDIINNDDAVIFKGDSVVFTDGIAHDDILLSRIGFDLVLALRGSTDRVTITSYFNAEITSSYKLEQIIFADGTIWSIDEIRTMALNGLNGDDQLLGTLVNDNLAGGSGNDVLYGNGGDDRLDGNTGNDTLYGDTGNDIIDGGAGNDTLFGGAGADTFRFGKGYGIDIISSSDALVSRLDIVEMFDIQSADVTFLRVGDSLVLSVGNGTDKLTIDYFFADSSAASTVKEIRFADGSIWNIDRIKSSVIFQGTAGNDQLTGSTGADVIMGGAGADALYGGAGNDQVLGQEGDDLLYGDEGDDVIDGGAGNDRLFGGAGADTFRFGKGYGIDLIGSSGALVYQLDAVEMFDIQSADVTFLRVGDSLVLSVGNGTDKLTIDYFFADSSAASTVKEIRFADGSIWNIDRIKSSVIFQGTAGNDQLTGSTGADVIMGGAGADTLNGGAGNDQVLGQEGDDLLYGDEGDDVIDGGAGNDRLFGGAGADTFRFGKGYGIDLIGSSGALVYQLDAVEMFDIQSADVTFLRVGDSLVLSVGNGTDKLTIDYFFADSSAASTVKEIRFADGSIWNIDRIKSSVIFQGTAGNDQLTGSTGADVIMGGAGADTLNGGAGNDQVLGQEGDDLLYGDEGDDVIDGGAGNDRLFGGAGADTFRFGKGYGLDLIGSSGALVNRLDAVEMFDIQSADVTFLRVGDSLVLSTDNGTDKLTIDYFFADSATASTVKEIKFADGSIWDLDRIRSSVPLLGTTGDDQLTGSTGVDVIMGGAGADTLNGGAGNDVIHGQEGNDLLYGEDGDDVIRGGVGNDTLSGGAGANQLYGDAGDDTIVVATGSKGNTLVGGTGNDTLTGGNYADTYVFNLGDGKDVITDYDGGFVATDTLRFGAGILASDITTRRVSSDLVFLHSNGM
ncbi:calcium-binding protein, partial [Pseudomonas sp. OA65]|uniref:calcium-binding protein n=1 Tax=Pseudomonas sp. OA65 TaxID=2818431 RepID=UPI001AC32862